INRAAAEAQNLRFITQESDAKAGAHCRSRPQRARIDFVIAETPDHARIGTQSRKLPDALVQGILVAGDQVASHKREVGLRTVCHVDGASKFAFSQERAQVDITELYQPQTVEVFIQTRYRN